MLGDVLAESPADKAGLHRHDIITAADGSKVDGVDALRQVIQSKKPGDAIKFQVQRGKERIEVQAKLGEAPARPESKVAEAEKPQESKPAPAPAKGPGFLGVGFAEVDPSLAAHLELQEGTGVLVGNVWKDSPAAKAGIEKNDVIVSVDGQNLEGARGILRLLAEKHSGDAVKIEVIHKGQKRTVDTVLADRPPELGRRTGSSRFPFGHPGLSNRGRVTIERPDGSQESFDVSGDGLNADELFQQFEERFKGLRGFLGPDEMNGRLRKLFEDMELGDLSRLPTGTAESRSAVVRIVDGEYDVTVRDQDGSRTVTVKQGDKVIAEDLPFDKIGTLSEEVQKHIEKAAESFDESRPAELPVGGAKKIKA
jgi:membrane-associated protease RseP (regulator of RpoE activity)